MLSPVVDIAVAAWESTQSIQCFVAVVLCCVFTETDPPDWVVSAGWFSTLSDPCVMIPWICEVTVMVTLANDVGLVEIPTLTELQ